MLVQAVSLHQFRNLATVTLEPSPGFNVFSGDNGQGKTNLLEALYLVGTLRSFRTTHGDEMPRFGEPTAQVKARVEKQGLERTYEVSLRPGGRDVRLDGKRPRDLSEYFGGFNVVLFAPEDLRVPRGNPAGRRRFLDRSVFNRDVTFLAAAQKYARVLKSRNALLREHHVNTTLLDVYDEQLAQIGDDIVRRRKAYLTELAPRFAEAFIAITRAGLGARLAYQVHGQAPGQESAEFAGVPLAEALAASRSKDLRRRQTTVGPHVDDVEFLLDERPARAFASQGQLRALVLAWKTAEMRLLREALGDAPVLLLDDVSSELDSSRNEFLFAFLREIDCQCFVTTTHPKHVLASENRLDFQVVSGRVTGPEKP
jgi:DNA replication and repair protein RecF